MRAESILLVEDNELILCSMHYFLGRDFTSVTAASTGEEAIAHLRRDHYRVVILDINLPGIDGWQVLEHIRRHSPQTGAIVITSSDDAGIRKKALQEGAYAFLEKPFDLGELKGIIAEILRSIEPRPQTMRPLEATSQGM